MRKLLGALLAAVLAAGVAAVAPGGPVRAQEESVEMVFAERVTALAGTNVITGSTSSFADVRIPRPATLDVSSSARRGSGPNPSVRVSGQGPFVGVVLVSDPTEEGDEDVVVAAGRFQECSGPACPEGRAPINFTAVEPEERGEGGRVRLPAGDYRLYLIADEGRARVTLRLGGLSGTRRLAPRHEAPAWAYRPENRADIGTAGAYYGAGKALDGGARGIVGQMMFFETVNFGGANYGACLYRNGVPPPEPVAYGTQCDAATMVMGERDADEQAADDDEVRVVFTSLLSWGPAGPPRPTGRVAPGVWYRQQGTVERLGSQAFYVSFDDDAPIPDKEKPWRFERGRLIQDWHYEGPAVGSGGGVCTHPIHACALFQMRATDRFLEVKIEDATGTPVLASVSQREGRGGLATLGSVCGETEEPFEVIPGAEIVIFPWAVGRANCPGVATTGNVTATSYR